MEGIIPALNPKPNSKWKKNKRGCVCVCVCSEKVGWSEETTFRTPPAAGDENDFSFIAFGDMGKAPLDSSSVEHYIQVLSPYTIEISIDGLGLNGNIFLG